MSTNRTDKQSDLHGSKVFFLVLLFSTLYNAGAYLYKCQSATSPSVLNYIYISLISNSHLQPFLEPTSTEQWRLNYSIKEQQELLMGPNSRLPDIHQSHLN